jgi:hypothetical protein
MIVAYTSGAVNPTQSQTDFIIDLQGGDTLPENAQLYGGGIDSSDPSASFTFSWSLLRKPTGSNATLNDSALQNPLLSSVDVWGNYLLFLIVTNSVTGETSQIDPIKAPPTAFLSVRVQSLELGLEKPSAGERDWYSKAHEWVDAIENHEERIDDLETLSQVFDLNSLSDVTLGTLSIGEVLKYDGIEWVNGSNNLDDLSDVTLGTLTSGEVLKYDGIEWVNGSNNLDDLSDVTLGTLTSGEVLKYDGNEWVNGSNNLDDLSDVTLGTLTTGEVLKYDGNEWVNGQAPSTLTIQDDYGINASTIDLVSQQLVLVSDNGSNTITHGTLNGNPKISIDVSSNLTVDQLYVNSDLTVNADGDATDPTIFMLDGSINTPAIIYDTSATTFKLKRTSGEGFVKAITEADQASTSQYGVVRVSPNTTGFNTSSRILDVERLMFTGAVDGMVDYKSGTQNHKSADNDVVIEAYSATNVAQHPAIVFKNVTGQELLVSDIALVMASAGISVNSEYAFSFVVYSSLGALSANTASTTYALPTFNRTSDNKVGACDFNYVAHNASTPLTVNPDEYFGILVTSSPDYAGNRLQCTIQGFRQI